MQIATEKLEKRRKVVKIPARDIASLRDNSPGLLLHDYISRGSIGHEGSPIDVADCIGSDVDSSSLQQFSPKS